MSPRRPQRRGQLGGAGAARVRQRRHLAGAGAPGAGSATSASAPRRSGIARSRCSGSASGCRDWAGWRGRGRAGAEADAWTRRRGRARRRGLFAGIPSPLRATRYHSLALAHPLPSSLRQTATCDGVPMAVEHRHRPQWGVQFHPESIATEHGKQLLANFRDLTPPRAAQGAFVNQEDTKAPCPAEARLAVQTLDGLPVVESAFVSLFGDSDHAFWLDSSRPGDRGRFSFMGDAARSSLRRSSDTARGRARASRSSIGSSAAWTSCAPPSSPTSPSSSTAASSATSATSSSPSAATARRTPRRTPTRP